MIGLSCTSSVERVKISPWPLSVRAERSHSPSIFRWLDELQPVRLTSNHGPDRSLSTSNHATDRLDNYILNSGQVCKTKTSYTATKFALNKKMVETNPYRKALSRVDVPAVVSFGNPLLDIIVVLQDQELLQKYNLPLDGQIEISSKKMKDLLAQLLIEAEQSVIGAGGCAQNTMRILQWLTDKSVENQIGIYCGGLGNDQNGALLEKLVKSAGIDARYAVHPSLRTGVCVSLINDTYRSLVANIGAAAVYTLDDLKKSNLSFDTIKIIYIEGFFVTHSFAVAKEIVARAEEENILIAFNLNGTYIFKDHHAAICKMVGYASIVFGNAGEMAALAQALNIKYSDVADIPFLLNGLKQVTVDVSSIASEDWLKNGSVFVMTQGGNAPTVLVYGKGQSVQVQPIVPSAPVVDTTGAGDALVAGFLAGVLAQCDPARCLQWGCSVASLIITRLGVTLPPTVPADLLQ